MAEALVAPQRGGVFARLTVLAGALLLAACNTVVPRAPMPSQQGPQTTAPRADDTNVAQGLPQDVARSRVALLVPLSGGNAGVGRSLANATQLALLVDGSIAQDLVRDDPAMARAAKQAATVLLKNAGVKVGDHQAAQKPAATKRQSKSAS